MPFGAIEASRDNGAQNRVSSLVMSKRQRRWRVLIFPGGTENGLEIKRSLQDAKEVEVLSASSPVENQGPYSYRHHFTVSHLSEPNWWRELNDLIHKHDIDVLFPSNSRVIIGLDTVRDKIDCDIIMPPREVLQILTSKRETLRILKGHIPIPHVYDITPPEGAFPLFGKPSVGYGGQGAVKIENLQHYELLRSSMCGDFLVQEYLPGREFTVDCFSSSSGKLLFCSGRERKRIRMGTAMHSRSVSSELNKFFNEIGQTILRITGIAGAWFFQMKESASGTLKLLEVDPRIAGTMALHRVQGVNFPLLSLYEFYGLPYTIMQNPGQYTIDRCLMNRYSHPFKFNTVYIDLDDTIITNDRINLTVIQFLFQCINDGKKIVLLSKSNARDRIEFLKRYRIQDLFDETIWLRESDSKAAYIKDNDAIFIDDSFSQRREVSEKIGIATFDLSMIEVLLNERV